VRIAAALSVGLLLESSVCIWRSAPRRYVARVDSVYLHPPKPRHLMSDNDSGETSFQAPNLCAPYLLAPVDPKGGAGLVESTRSRPAFIQGLHHHHLGTYRGWFVTQTRSARRRAAPPPSRCPGTFTTGLWSKGLP
jgi:hypothetical protein